MKTTISTIRTLCLLAASALIAGVLVMAVMRGSDTAEAGSSCYNQCSAQYGQCLASTNGNQAACSAARKSCLARCSP